MHDKALFSAPTRASRPGALPPPPRRKDSRVFEGLPEEEAELHVFAADEQAWHSRRSRLRVGPRFSDIGDHFSCVPASDSLDGSFYMLKKPNEPYNQAELWEHVRVASVAAMLTRNAVAELPESVKVRLLVQASRCVPFCIGRVWWDIERRCVCRHRFPHAAASAVFTSPAAATNAPFPRHLSTPCPP